MSASEPVRGRPVRRAVPPHGRLSGDDPATALRREAFDAVGACHEAGADPCLGTVLVSDDEGTTAFVDRKHDRCVEVGIDTRRVDLPTDAPAGRVYGADQPAADPDSTAPFVQVPLPDHVDETAARERVPPEEDVDRFAPAASGR